MKAKVETQIKAEPGLGKYLKETGVYPKKVVASKAPSSSAKKKVKGV